LRHEPLCPAYEHAENHEDTYWCTDECDLAECFCDSIAEIRADERAATLRDVIEVVKISCSADIELIERSQVLAEIEALGVNDER
jgi:hypothetical protein